MEKIVPISLETQANIEKWSAGLYFLKIKDAEGNRVQSLKVAKK